MNKKVRKPTEIDIVVGERLKELRAGRSYKSFATRYCVNEDLLPLWEKGVLQAGKYVLCLIARKHHEPMTIKDFFDGDPPPKDYPN